MNISVECYEELYLNGKDTESIASEVENIRRHIARVKYEMEAPAFSYENRFYPSLLADIEICRKYLSSAIQALNKLKAGVDFLSEEEKASLIFDGECRRIAKLSLTLGRYFEKKYELIFGEASATVMRLKLEEEPEFFDIDLEEAISQIYELHMGEWQEFYRPEDYSCTLNEPCKWHLKIEYKDGIAPRVFEGIGIFPYNFASLCKLLGAETE